MSLHKLTSQIGGSSQHIRIGTSLGSIGGEENLNDIKRIVACVQSIKTEIANRRQCDSNMCGQHKLLGGTYQPSKKRRKEKKYAAIKQKVMLFGAKSIGSIHLT